jgi:mRNA interferase MazF
MIQQGDVWLMEPPNDKRRPVLIVTRSDAIAVLDTLVVAPLTTTIRKIPTCIPVGAEQGVDRDSVASFDNLAAVPRSILTLRLGTLGVTARQQVCAALEALADC